MKGLRKKSVYWVVPEEEGGIASYSKVLWAPCKERLQENGWEATIEFASMRGQADRERILQGVRAADPGIVHIQHEFGLFGSKVPPFYYFPRWFEDLRRAVPDALFLGTAHTVLDAQYRYPLERRGWQKPVRWLANQFLLPFFLRSWTTDTWSEFDQVFVHSSQQVKPIEDSGCEFVEELPHFVSDKTVSQSRTRKDPLSDVLEEVPEGMPVAVVFGYISPDKGQDVLIEAIAQMEEPVHLLIAGGLRRGADARYFEACRRMIRGLEISDRVTITGFLDSEMIDQIYENATVVVAPFRETSGSGSLAQALSRDVPILASDHPLNLEIERRVPGCLEFFRRGSPENLATRLEQLLRDGEKRKSLSQKAAIYAEKYSVEKIAESLVGSYLKF